MAEQGAAASRTVPGDLPWEPLPAAQPAVLPRVQVGCQRVPAAAHLLAADGAGARKVCRGWGWQAKPGSEVDARKVWGGRLAG
jgi:hypothetical protein